MKNIVFIIIVALLLVSLCSCTGQGNPVSSENEQVSHVEPSSSSNSGVSSPQSSVSENEVENENTQVGTTTDEEQRLIEDNEESMENPQGAPNDEDNIKQLEQPMFDPFPLQYPFLTAHVEDTGILTPISIIQIDMISGPEEQAVTITSKEQIDTLWTLMGNTEITTEGANEANPSTGGNMTLKFLFSDGSTAKVIMANLVWLNDNGPFLFADETSEQLYWDFFFSMQ